MPALEHGSIELNVTTSNAVTTANSSEILDATLRPRLQERRPCKHEIFKVWAHLKSQMHSDAHDFKCLPDCNNKIAANESQFFFFHNNMKSIHNRVNINVDTKLWIRGRV